MAGQMAVGGTVRAVGFPCGGPVGTDGGRRHAAGMARHTAPYPADLAADGGLRSHRPRGRDRRGGGVRPVGLGSAYGGAGGGGRHGRCQWRASRPGPRPAPSAPPVLPALGGRAPGPRAVARRPPTDAGLADALAPLLKDPALGPLRSASVLDVAAGREVFGDGQGKAVTPASTVKLATAVAALSARGPDHRIDTTVVLAGKNRLILVGGGDPTLTARAPRPGAGEQPANLRTLADATARALKKRHLAKISLGYDASAYTGPTEHPIGPNENIAPVTALMTDEARLDDSEHGTAPATPTRPAPPPTPSPICSTTAASPSTATPPAPRPPRSPTGSPPSTPSPVRARRADAHLQRQRHRRGTGPPDRPRHPPAGQLHRRRKGRPHRPPARAPPAVRRRLRGRQRPGPRRQGHRRPALRLLLHASSPDHPALRPVVTGLPVAAFTGTLSNRYRGQSAGAGAVRAKTGTLTGVNTLAGTVVDADGRLLVFSFMTTGTTDPQGAQEALDKLASAVANCGCR